MALIEETDQFCIKLGDALSRNRNAYPSAWSICALAIVGGQVQPDGGGIKCSKSLTYVPWQSGIDFVDQPLARRKTYFIGNYAQTLINETCAIKATYIYNANPVASLSDSMAVRQALQKNDIFTVVHDLYMTETARYADLVLPASSQYEQYDLVGSYQHDDISLNIPLFTPPAGAKSNFEVANLIGTALFPEESVFQQSEEDTIDGILKATSRKTNLLDGLTFSTLKSGHRLPMREARRSQFSTATGRPELFNPRSNEILTRFFTIKSSGTVQRRNDTLYLLTVASKKRLSSSLTAGTQDETYPTKVLLHPDDAAQRDIEHGDKLLLSNGVGSLVTQASVTKRTLPGTIVVENGAPGCPNLITSDIRGLFEEQLCYQGSEINVQKL